jgi:hypothetical protein
MPTQINFLDADTGLTAKPLGKPVASDAPSQPTAAEKSKQIAGIIEAMEYSRNHEYGVTTALLVEICGSRSVRQRISDARKIYQRKGLNIVYRSEGDSYFLEPYKVK